MRIRILPLFREAAVNTFKCRLCLNPNKEVHLGYKGSDVPMLFEASVNIILIILLLGGFQALLGCFGLVGGGVSIHEIHVVDTVHPLNPEVSDEKIFLQLSLVLIM